MKIKILFLVGCLSFCTSLQALDNHHVYPNPDGTNSLPKENGSKWPGYCEIEIINDSFTNIRVYGVFDDDVILRPFNIYRYEYPHYISLYYYGYCHYGMDIHIDTLSGYNIYDGYTRVNTSLHIIPYMMASKPKIEIQSKEAPRS